MTMHFNEIEKIRSDCRPAENKYLKVGESNCNECGEELNHTGFQKLIHPPLDILICKKCKLEFFRESI